MAQADAYTRGGTDPLIPPHACGAGWRLAYLFNLAFRRAGPMPRGASDGVVVARLLAEKANGRRVPRRRSSCCTGSRHSDCSGMRGSIDRRIYGSTWDLFNVYIGFLQVLASFRLCPCCQGKGAALFRGWHGTDPPSNFRLPREHARKPPNLCARFSFGGSSSADRSGLRTTQAVHCRMSDMGVELSP
ncbi:hypothetical protein PTKU46_78010 [Paraburkholderia terrae]